MEINSLSVEREHPPFFFLFCRFFFFFFFFLAADPVMLTENSIGYICNQDKTVVRMKERNLNVNTLLERFGVVTF